MFLGHFALGAAAKPVAPKMPIWILLLAPQFMDLVFIILYVFGIEGVRPDGNLEVYGQFKGNILYSHSLVGALLISAVAFGIGKTFWKSTFNGWVLAGLSFSHWPLDLWVHHQDMPILPGNLGGLPLLGFGAWNYPGLILGVEIALAVVGVGLYFGWANKEKLTPRWYIGPIIVAILFGLQSVMDITQLP